MLFSKKSHWNKIFPVLSGKMIFHENMILFSRRKMKENLSQKNTWKYGISFKCSAKTACPKIRTGVWSFLYYPGRWYFFSRKFIFFLGRKMKDDLSQEIHGHMIFSIYIYKCYKYDITLLPKASKMIFSRKNSVKGDWHSRLTF